MFALMWWGIFIYFFIGMIMSQRGDYLFKERISIFWFWPVYLIIELIVLVQLFFERVRSPKD